MNRREMIGMAISGTAGVIGLGGTASAAAIPSAAEHLAKVTEALRDVVRAQSAEAHMNPYMQGLANGLILALSLLQGGRPEYVASPAVWLDNDEPSMTPAGAVERLSRAFQADPDYANGWHANAACAAMDEGLDPEAANRAAARFMRAAFSVDTGKGEHWQPSSTKRQF